MANQKIELVKGGRKVDGVFEPISSAALNPQRDMTITTPAPATKGAGLLAGIETGTKSFFDKQQAKTQQAEEMKDTSMRDYINTLMGQSTKSDLQLQADKEYNVLNLENELNDINNQILQEQVSRQRRIEQAEKNMGGGLASGVQNEVERITRESIRKEADLSLIALARQGKYDSAKQRAEFAVQAQFERQEKELEARKMMYEDNKELFNKQEEREFNVAWQAERDKIEDEKQTQRDIYAVMNDFLKEGGDAATAQQIAQSKTIAEAISKTGNVLGATARLQRQKLVAEIDKIMNPPDASLLTGKDRFDAQLQLAEMFNKRSGDYKTARTQLDNIRSAFDLAVTQSDKGESIAASSQALITGFNKLLDPTSVVRESEYARSAEGLSLMSRLEGQYSRLSEGGAGITAADLREFRDTAESFMRGYENRAIDEAQLIIDQAVPAGLDVTQIIPNSVLDLMETRFEEALDSTPIGGTFTQQGVTYKKLSDNSFEPI